MKIQVPNPRRDFGMTAGLSAGNGEAVLAKFGRLVGAVPRGDGDAMLPKTISRSWRSRLAWLMPKRWLFLVVRGKHCRRQRGPRRNTRDASPAFA